MENLENLEIDNGRAIPTQASEQHDLAQVDVDGFIVEEEDSSPQ